jgi:predicted nucleotidyltransferase
LEDRRSADLRKRVAREAAALLYTSQEKEYKQAKKRAIKTLGVRVLPSNLEVAEELDKIAEEREGQSRQERLLQMRKEALKIMGVLKNFHPKLIGSVWRGTTRQNSDIDIVTFSSAPETILAQLQKSNFKVTKTEWLAVTKMGKKESSFHIYLALPSSNEVEVVVRSPERINRLERCETYGDAVTGLNYHQLQKILKENPLQKFVPT